MPLLEAADLIATRLKQRCPSACGNIFQAADLAGVKEKAQVTPALHVVLYRYRPTGDDAGSSSVWQETYLVVAVVKNARQREGAEAIRNEAAPLLAEALAALDGWKCPGSSGLMRAIEPPGPLTSDSHGYFPLAFSLTTLTEGASSDF